MTFEVAYERLEEICDRLADSELTLEPTLDLLREGRGIEAALRERLDGFQQELEEIEAGKGLVKIEIIPAPEA
jgi:exodeoxyribonuclease VII small subunit